MQNEALFYSFLNPFSLADAVTTLHIIASEYIQFYDNNYTCFITLFANGTQF